MLAVVPNCMCTGKPEPRAWEMNGRSGVSYKVNLSDGTSALELAVADAETWNAFVPFRMYNVTLEITQVAYESRLSTRTRVCDAEESDK